MAGELKKISDFSAGGAGLDDDKILIERVSDGEYYWVSRAALLGALTNHSDVNISGPSTGQVLQFNGSVWANATPGGGGGGATTLDGLDDVAITTPSAGQVLRHNGTQFVNSPVNAADIGDSGAAGRAVLQKASEAEIRTQLGLVIGSNVQAYDAELAALAGLASAADKLPYFTGAGTAALTDLSSSSRGLLAQTSTADWRTSLGLSAIAASGSASDLNVGVVPLARLGSDTPNVNEFLAWDNTWRVPAGSGFTPEIISGTTHTIDATAANKRFFYTNTSNITVTVASDASGIVCDLVWLAPAGTITIVPASSPSQVTINGVTSSIVLTAVAGAVTLLPLPTATNPRQFYLVGSVGDLVVTDITDSGTAGRQVVMAEQASDGRTALAAAATSQPGSEFSFLLPTVSAGDTTVRLKTAHGGTITRVSTQSTSGTCDLRMKINGVNVGSANNAVSTTLVDTTPASANTFAEGDKISVNISNIGNPAAVNVAVTVKYSRTLQ